ncbi:hypothetical protein HanRHA438_Chr08g0368181 [Helianthus annuus]|nr:hypothetical protein HanRHA438_Chr08g0368181 [Helianthus annuus]
MDFRYCVDIWAGNFIEPIQWIWMHKVCTWIRRKRTVAFKSNSTKI